MKTAAQYLHIKHSGESKEREKCLVISDLHLGAPYSDANEAATLLQEQLGDPSLKHCILLGDIFEGMNLPEKNKMVTLFGVEKLAKKYMESLRDIIKKHPHITFHYVVGNHERLPEFDREIDALAKEFPESRLTVTRHFIKIGDGLFMHGDQAMNPKKYALPDELADTYDSQDHRYKESYSEMYRSGLYEDAYNLGNVYLPWGVGRMFHRISQCAQKIFDWAHEFDIRNPATDDPFHSNNRPTGRLSILPREGILSDVKHIFMGHTHDPFTAAERTDNATGRSYKFYNAGAPVFRRGIRGNINRHCFNAMNFYLSEDNTIDEVHSVKWPYHNWVSPESEVAQSHIAKVMNESRASQARR